MDNCISWAMLEYVSSALCHCITGWVVSDILKETVTSILKGSRSTLTHSFKISPITYPAMQHHISDDQNSWKHHCKNPKSCRMTKFTTATPRRWRQHVTPQCRYPPRRLYIVMTQKTITWCYSHTHLFNKKCNTTQNLMQVQTISTSFGLSQINIKHFRESEIS